MRGINIDRAHKYRNVKTVVDGITFDSRKELKRWQELKLLERTGEIWKLQYHVVYELIPKIGKNRPTTYEADFVYMDESGKTIVEDAKGYRTEVYRIKKKLMKWVHDIDVVEV